jgi:hypothetical protein
MFARESEVEIKLPIGMSIILSDDQGGGYLGAGIWHKAHITFQANPPKITSVEINSVKTEVDIITSSGLVKPSPLEIKCIKGNFAFGDVRFKTSFKELDDNKWEPVQPEGGSATLEGTSTETISLSQSDFSAIRFDTKISGSGHAVIVIGDVEVSIATHGDNKTGSIAGHPIKANLIDQNEWCTIEINQENGTIVYLNDVPILTVYDAPSIKTHEIIIHVYDAELSLRRTYIWTAN